MQDLHSLARLATSGSSSTRRRVVLGFRLLHVRPGCRLDARLSTADGAAHLYQSCRCGREI
jgi:hypothetical protein